MCFIKNLKILTNQTLHMTPSSTLSDDQLPSKDTLNQHQEKKNSFFEEWAMSCSQKSLKLCALMERINTNSALLFNLNNKLQTTLDSLKESQGYFNNSHSESEKMLDFQTSQIKEDLLENKDIKSETVQNSLSQKLFGKHPYKFKLELCQEFPKILYKERNFNFKIKLIDISSENYQRNSNLINVCLSPCDSNGDWIYQNKEGISFLKGKVEIEVYHGEGEFCKISAKDVSRQFEGKVVNFVIYAKPSILKYSGESSMESHVDYRQVQPLIIQNITIKAKKRE